MSITTPITAPAPSKRVCGDCQLCCQLIPVEEIQKRGFTKCTYQKVNIGCQIYNDRPMSCRGWSCGWLSEPTTVGLNRPDRSHYIIDPSLGKMTIIDDETGVSTDEQMLELWVPGERYKLAPLHDPKFQAWHRTYCPDLVCLVRYTSLKGISMIPPSRTKNKDGKWIIKEANIRTDFSSDHPDDDETKQIRAGIQIMKDDWNSRKHLVRRSNKRS